MKKIIALIAGLAVCGLNTQSSFAQTAAVNFSNDFGAVVAPVFDTNGTTPLAGTGYSVGLLAGTSAGNMTLIDTIAFTSNSGGGGYFYGGTVDLSSVGVGAAGVGTVQVEVWQTAAGSFANSTVRGVSNTFTVQTGNETTSPPGVQGVLSNMTAVTLQNVGAVPEPSVLALGALGGLALLFRRRK